MFRDHFKLWNWQNINFKTKSIGSNPRSLEHKSPTHLKLIESNWNTATVDKKSNLYPKFCKDGVLKLYTKQTFWCLSAHDDDVSYLDIYRLQYVAVIYDAQN